MTRAVLSILLVLAGLAPACAATLTIRVQDVWPQGGILRLGVYDETRYPDDNSKPIASADIAAVSPETVVVLHNVPPGTYAIQTFQDVNGNDKMDTNWMGLPLEPFGFSLDAKPFLSKPAFGDVKFTVSGDATEIIHLQSMARNSPTDKARAAIGARQRK